MSDAAPLDRQRYTCVLAALLNNDGVFVAREKASNRRASRGIEQFFRVLFTRPRSHRRRI